MTDLKRIIANNIADLRKSVPYTQAELAEKLQYSDKAISKWERGESVPDIIVLKQIAQLFGVTVDYLLEEEHSQKDKMQLAIRQINRNHMLITGLACMLVFLIATLVFVVSDLATAVGSFWLAYVYCVPVCSILLIVFNSIWGQKWWNFVFISLLMWSILACIYLTIGIYGNWLIFVIGVPGQIIILMWSGIKSIFKKKAK